MFPYFHIPMFPFLFSPSKEMDIIKALNWRYATKAFDPKRKLSTQQIKVIKEILRLTPTSLGLQLMKCLIIKDQKIKDKLFDISKKQTQVTSCSHLIVFTVPTKVTNKMIDEFLTLIQETRWTSKEALEDRKQRIQSLLQRYRDAGEIDSRLKQQVNIALGNLLTSCALLKIDSCPLGAIQTDEYDKILWLKKQGVKTVLACALGYRAKDDGYAKVKKVRRPTEKIIEEL